MNVYLIGEFENPTVESYLTCESSFARFAAVGTWEDDGSRCEACGWHGEALVEPLLVHWELGGDRIGDFSWDGPFGLVTILTDNVIEFLRDSDYECAFHSVEYVPPEKRVKATCIHSPYTGPKQQWMKCTRFVHLDRVASNATLKASCDTCGRMKYTFRKEGIAVPRTNWNGAKMFRIFENGDSSATFVTDEARQEIEAQGFSNVSFSLAGRITG